MNDQIYRDAAGSEGDEVNLERHWILEVRKGDRVAFRLIFEKYYESLTRFAFRYVHTNADAEGAVQDVFLWVWEKRENWLVEGSLKTYLYRAVKHRCLDLIRKNMMKEKYVSGQLEDQQTSPQYDESQTDFDSEKFEQLVKKAIESLPDRAKMVYKLSRSDGLTYNEIAKVLEISPKTVESQMSRALNTLRAELSKYVLFLFTIKNLLFNMI